MTAIRHSERDRRQDHLVRREGVAPEDADAFLDLLDLLQDSDPPFHAEMASELDGRMLRVASAEASTARAALARIALARDTRAGPSEVRALVDLAARAAGTA